MSTAEKKLFLLDAMALIYRAHFAFVKNPRINSKGMSTGAIFGFANTLLEILSKEKPSHIAVAFDTKAPTFRHREMPEYKANRQEQPEDIEIAIPWVKKLVQAFDIPCLEKDGWEADDLIGTIAWKAADQGITVYMMTPDKDYGQLVKENVFLYKPAFMGNGVDIMGVKEVLQKWDIERIDQVVDMLGLMGDKVDNIPGIPGVGEKTAVKYLKDYGTVEGLLAHSHELKGKAKERVEEFADQALLSKKMARIDTEAPVDFDPKALEYTGPNREKVMEIFEELEFRTMARRLFGEDLQAKSSSGVELSGEQLDMFASASPSKAMEQPPALSEEHNIHTTRHDYRAIQTEDEMEHFLFFLKKQKVFAFDTETTDVDPIRAELVGMSFAYRKQEAFYVPVPEDKQDALRLVERFKEVLENSEVLIIGQNIKYDMVVMRKYGIQIGSKVYDTMLAHYLLDPETRHNMDYMAQTYLGYTPVSITELIGKRGKKQGNMRDVPLAEIAPYAAEDADITLQLKETLHPLVQKEGLDELLETVELPLVEVLADMEYEGIRVDANNLHELSAQLEEEINALEKEIYEMAGERFNIASPKQLGEILFDKLKLSDKPKKTKTGQYATGEEILSALAVEHALPARILDIRELQKLKSTYVDALPKLINPEDGRVHTSFNQAVAATGRLSSTNPNLQNIPIRTDRGRLIRKAFVARDEDHLLLAADYSQIELRLMAAFSGDETMVQAFKDGKDIHAATAAKIFKVPIEEVDSTMRRTAKTANFGIIYGISAFGLSQRLGIPRREAADIIEAYFREFPGVKAYMDRAIEKARKEEYVETILGRRRYLRDINSRNMTTRGFAERNAINAPLQGSAADLIKVAMIKVHAWLKKEKLRSKMILQVHDELIFDAHHSELEILKKEVPRIMASAIKLDIPIVVETGTGNNWLEAH
jgi:DNA polymerase-1